MWLNPNSANKISIAIGAVVKETKPGKTLVEDDEGKVSMAGAPGGWAPQRPGPLPRALSPGPSLMLPPIPCVAGQRGILSR